MSRKDLSIDLETVYRSFFSGIKMYTFRNSQKELIMKTFKTPTIKATVNYDPALLKSNHIYLAATDNEKMIMMNETIKTMDVFAQVVKEAVEASLSDGYEVSIHEVLKNNNKR